MAIVVFQGMLCERAVLEERRQTDVCNSFSVDMFAFSLTLSNSQKEVPFLKKSSNYFPYFLALSADPFFSQKMKEHADTHSHYQVKE